MRVLPARLLIEGWRFIHHSYALVAQSHCLCLVDRPEVVLRFRDLPYYNDTWRRTRGIFSQENEERLAAIAPPDESFHPEATLTMRAERPDFSAPAHGRKFVFGTPEHRSCSSKTSTIFDRPGRSMRRSMSSRRRNGPRWRTPDSGSRSTAFMSCPMASTRRWCTPMTQTWAASAPIS